MTSKNALPMSAVILAALSIIFNVSGAPALQSADASLADGTQINDDGANHPQIIRWVLRRMAHRLDLTDDQKTEIRSIIDAELPEIKPLVQQLLDIRDQFQLLHQNDSYDDQQVRSLAAQQAAVLQSLIIVRERIRHEVDMVLTPEQRAKADEMRNRLEARLRVWLTS